VGVQSLVEFSDVVIDEFRGGDQGGDERDQLVGTSVGVDLTVQYGAGDREGPRSRPLTSS
jgi:hypothetical protein